MESWQWIWLFLAGAIAGLMNTVGGGGSLLTLPALLLMGLPATVANGTNRLALVAQNVVAVRSFSQAGVQEFARGWRLAIPSVIGAWLGARLALEVPEELFRRILAGVLVGALLMLWSRPRRATTERTTPRPLTYVLFFLLGVYGGFIQAGIGLLIVFVLVGLEGMSLAPTHATKMLVVLCYQLVSLLVFLRAGAVAWLPGLVLACGNMTGAWLAVRFAVRRGERGLRIALTVCVLTMAATLVAT